MSFSRSSAPESHSVYGCRSKPRLKDRYRWQDSSRASGGETAREVKDRGGEDAENREPPKMVQLIRKLVGRGPQTSIKSATLLLVFIQKKQTQGLAGMFVDACIQQ